MVSWGLDRRSLEQIRLAELIRRKTRQMEGSLPSPFANEAAATLELAWLRAGTE
jgi:hypothetical protein